MRSLPEGVELSDSELVAPDIVWFRTENAATKARDSTGDWIIHLSLFELLAGQGIDTISYQLQILFPFYAFP
jgi:hypothetical protein